MGNDTNTTHVATTSNHCNSTSIELDEVGDLASVPVNLDSVIDLDGWVWVADSSSIMRNQVWDSSFANLHSLNLAGFVFCLSLFDAVDSEAAFGIVDKTEVLASLVDGDDIHVASRIGKVCSNLAIDLDQALHQDGSRLAVIQGVLEAVSEEDNQRKAVSSFVRARGCLRGIGTR